MPAHSRGRVLAPRRRAGTQRNGHVTPQARFDFVESKLRVPVPRPGVVSRTALVNRLRVTQSFPVATLTAPAGYGKTTLLAQWLARDKRAFAWVSIDERDNDPIVLLRHIAAALHEIEPLEEPVLDALRSPGDSMWTAVVPRLGSVLASCERPLVLVLDDAHLLRSRDSTGAVSALVDHISGGSMLVLAGRVQPRLRIAALRAGGRLLELDVDDLALSRREARALLASTGIDLAEHDVEELVRRTEGWAAGLYLAALALRERDGENGSSPDEIPPFAGDDRYLADYFRSEYLSRLAPEQLTFLRRTSVLGKMSGPLCDRVLERRESGAELASIEKSNLFLVPLDRHREWYRYHHLFHDLLARELDELEPELVPVLHRRAADWFEESGDPESALEHADAAGDADRVARLVASLALPVYYSGRLAAVESWLDRFGDVGGERYPAVAVIGAWIHALHGQANEAQRWLEMAARGAGNGKRANGSESVRPWIALLRSALCCDGVEQMLRDAEGALDELPPASQWRPTGLLLQGAAYVLLGDDERGDRILADAAEAAECLGATDTNVVAISERSLLAAARDEPTVAEELSLRAHALVEEGHLGGYVTSSIELAATARALLRHGRWDQARACLTAARRLTPFLTHALPWFAVQTRLELARTHLALRDGQGARALLLEARQILHVRPRLGVLPAQLDALQAEVESMPEVASGNGTGLTGAELRLLPLLATHFSFREIGERLHVSRNTVKTQAISVYRKLGVSNRSDAIEQAARLGLVDAETRE